MPANTSTMSTLFKTTYEAGIKNQLNSARPFLRMFENMDTKDWTGMEKIVKVRVNRNRGSYYAAEGGAIPVAGQQRLEDLHVPMRYQYGGISVTKQLMEATRSNASSVARTLRFEMDGLVDDMRIQASFAMTSGYGVGIRALADGDPGTDTRMEVDAPGGVAGTVNGARYLNEGDNIVAVDPATGDVRAGGTREITGLASDGSFVDVSAAFDASWADNDQIIKAYGPDASISIDNTDFNHLPMGLLGLVDDGTFFNNYFGLNRTSFPIMRSFVLSGVTALSADVVMRAIHNVFQIGRARIRYHWMHPDVLRSYITLTQTDRRYSHGELLTPDAGTVAADQDDESNSGLKFGTVPIHIDLDLPFGMWFGIDPRSCARYVMNPGSWVDDDGAVLTRSATQVDTFTAQYRVFEQFVKFQPNQSFRLEGIDTTSVVVHRV